MTNYLDRSTFNGMKIFKVQRNHSGTQLVNPCYVSFRHGLLCGYYSTNVSAELGFLKGDVHEMNIRLNQFDGIDERLRR